MVEYKDVGFKRFDYLKYYVFDENLRYLSKTPAFLVAGVFGFFVELLSSMVGGFLYLHILINI
ncbi:hypothetical protein [Carboxydothermus hydrogenoformans]|uniref:Uncharacterized protein n=1 Tax=Carboxydothermus hydrogenoformans (strain ATCC BAA-161 / DSM 6008 / Z-2901) TaxID=246194 RepID=Q3AD90_CARHZ|nr:hypothetical protein [Carboxydothermus hydrogenoformans]ABB13866.1 hypothetical protein CHY_1048 [Carboxydothermus hydrogenoformans Z-2901]